MSPLYMGVDIGTSTTKGTVINERGAILTERILVRSRRFAPQVCWEDDPDREWWRGFVNIVQALLSDLSGEQGSLLGLAVTGMFYNVCPATAEGVPLRNALLYPDQRARSIELQLNTELGAGPFVTEGLSKLIWLKSQMGQEWSQVRKLFGTSNYVVWHLTGSYCTDIVSATESGHLFDRSKHDWDREVLTRYGIDPDLLPSVVTPERVIGYVTEEAADLTGLKAGMPVCAGSSDTFATVLGSGARCVGSVLICYGTYGGALLLREDILQTIRMGYVNRLYEWLTAIDKSGLQIEMLARLLLGHSPTREHSPVQLLDRLAQESVPGANGVIWVQASGLPQPTTATQPRGSFHNIGLENETTDICRAVLEAFGYALRHGLECDKLPTGLIECFAVGGGARSAVLRQITTDILDLGQYYSARGYGAFGSALLAALAVDPDAFRTIIESTAAHLSRCIPNADVQSVYDVAYQRYKHLRSHYPI